jgi:hypothetical protein
MTNKGMSLNEQLASLGFTTAPAGGRYKKHIMKGSAIAFTGDAGAVWEWLKESKLID